MENIYKQVSDERYEIIMKRYLKFSQSLGETDLEPVKVFDPLPKKLIEELELIREVSTYLQKKKVEDLNKAAQAAEEAEEAAKKKAAEDAAEKAEKENAAKEVEKEDA